MASVEEAMNRALAKKTLAAKQEPAPALAPAPLPPHEQSTQNLVQALHNAHPAAAEQAGQTLAQSMQPAAPVQQQSMLGAPNAGPAFDFSDPHAAEKQAAHTDAQIRQLSQTPKFDFNAPPSQPATPPAVASNMPPAPPGAATAEMPQAPADIDSQLQQIGNATVANDHAQGDKIETAEVLARQGADEKAQAEMAGNTANAPLLAEKVQVDQQSAELTSKVNDWIVEQNQQIHRHAEEMRDRYQLEAARDPTNLWGNWSTSQKIGGIIGIIAAGFAHQDATARVEHLVDQSVADSNRRMENLKLMGQADKEVDASNQQVYGSQINANNMEKAAKLEIIANKMDITANSMANPIAKANLLATHAQIMGTVVKLREDVAKSTIALRLQNVDEQLKLKELGTREQIAAMAAMRPDRASQAFMLKQQQRELEGGVIGLKAPDGYKGTPYVPPGPETTEYRKSSSAGVTMMQTVQKAIDTIDQIHYAELHGHTEDVLRLQADYNALKVGLLSAWRTYTVSGANITGPELTDLENRIPSFFRALTGGGEIMQDKEAMRMGQYLIAKNLQNKLNGLSVRTAAFNEEDPLFAPAFQWGREQEKRYGRRVQVDDIVAGKRAAYREQQDKAAANTPGLPDRMGMTPYSYKSKAKDLLKTQAFSSPEDNYVEE